jgi:hypothetical protein
LRKDAIKQAVGVLEPFGGAGKKAIVQPSKDKSKLPAKRQKAIKKKLARRQGSDAGAAKLKFAQQRLKKQKAK